MVDVCKQERFSSLVSQWHLARRRQSLLQPRARRPYTRCKWCDPSRFSCGPPCRSVHSCSHVTRPVSSLYRVARGKATHDILHMHYSISPEPYIQTSPYFLCMLATAVAWSSSGGVAIWYVRPVYWMTSYLPLSALWHRRWKYSVSESESPSGSTNFTSQHVFSLQCFDAVGWAAGWASGLKKTEWWGTGVVICLERGAAGPADVTATHCLLLQ